MKNILFLICFLFSLHALSQKKWNSRDEAKLEDADIYLEITDYQSAMEIYRSLQEKYSEDGHLTYKIGLCEYGLGDRTKATETFSKALELGNINASYYLGEYHHSIADFEKAMYFFEQYKHAEGDKEISKKEVDRKIQCTETAEKLMNQPTEAVVYNLGEKINGSTHDYGPLIKGDESVLIFTSRRKGSTGLKKDPYGEYLEDIYISHREGERWTEARNIGRPLNSETHDAGVGLSSDGKNLILYRTNEELTAGDLYLSTFRADAWSEPKMLDEAINSEYQEASAVISDDERIIYFSSNRPGGYGGKDIYRVVRISEDIWSLPMNLGPSINTEYDEDAPFLHPDGQHLYFSSKGHKNMGGYDVFVSSLNEEYWSFPKNLGYPVNTVGNDIFFVLAKDGKRGYYSSERNDGFGGQDIYAISFENNVERLRVVKGKVTSKEGEPLAASIEVLYQNEELFGTHKSNDKTGNYIIILPPDENFIVRIAAEGFSEQEEKMMYQGGTNVKEKIKNYTLVKSIEQ